MASKDAESKYNELLFALDKAKRQVARIETALAGYGALLGRGTARADAGGGVSAAVAAHPYDYIELAEPEDDISDFIGSEGVEETRPRLGENAPKGLRPKTSPELSPLVGQLTLAHPDDSIAFQSEPEESIPVPPGSAPLAAASPSPSFPPAPSSVDPSDLLRADLALQAVDDGIWDWDITGKRLYTSPRWREIVLGRSDIPVAESDLPAEDLAASLQPTDAESLRTRLSDLLAGRIGRMRMTVRIRRPNGTWAWGLLRGVCRREADGPSRVVFAMADITAQREAEAALQASEQKFRALTEDSPDLICRFDADANFLYAGPAVSRYLPVTPENVVGRSLFDFDFGEELPFVVENLKQAFEMGVPVQAEAHLVSPLVGPFVADYRFWPEFGLEGEVVSITAQVRDMTLARRLAENYQALFTRMADGFALFEHTPDSDAYAARSGMRGDGFTLLAMNPALGRIMGVDPQKNIGLRLSEMLGRDTPLWAACLSKVLHTGAPVFSTIRGTEPFGIFELSAYSPEEGRVACIIKDVTELKTIEQEVRLNEARFAALYRLSHMDDAPEEDVVQFALDQAVYLTGSAYGYFAVLQGHERRPKVFYWSREIQARYAARPEIPPASELALKEGGFLRSIQRAESINAPVPKEAGEVFGGLADVARYMQAPVVEDGRVVCIAVVADKEQNYERSDLRQLELFINGMWFLLRRRRTVQDLQRAKEEAEAASRAKDEFLANVSHELRTPLNGILGMLQLLQQSGLTPEQMECVVTANQSSRGLLRIISDILDFSRIEAGRMELAPQPFDLPATVRSTLGIFIHQAEQRKITFSLHMDAGLPRALSGDEARVRQIIVNLVGNAFKFTEEGEISVECRLLPVRKNGKHQVYFTVRDTGIGIPDSRLSDIFQAFTQIDGSSTRRYAGTGLGLGIVQRLVKLMNGTLAVESELGKGTTMHLTLPFDEAEMPVAETELPGTAEPASPLRILVAEDDPVNRLTITGLLRKTPHTAVCVNDGRQALEALMLGDFNCLLTDIQMPVMDGVELVSRIRSGNFADIEPTESVYNALGLSPSDSILHGIPADLPVIALTAHAMTGDKERFLSLGMDHYLSKPVSAVELQGVLNHVSFMLHSSKR